MTDKKASQDYINTAKSLLLLLACVDQTDQKRMKLISMLFPLLPGKFRYTLEKLGRKLCFEKSALFSNSKSNLSPQHFETIKKLTPQLMVDERSSLHSSVIDSASQDRILLEDMHKVLSILAKASIDPSHLFVLLPDRHVRKAQAIINEIAKEDFAKAREKSLQKKGEECINPALFQRSRPDAIRPTSSEQLEEAETKDMAASLTKANAIYLEKKNRVIAQQSHSKDNKRASIQTKTAVAPKRLRKSNIDDVDIFLNQVKNDVYQPRIDRLNGKIKANVPKSFTCSLCNTHAKEVNILCYNILLLSVCSLLRLLS